MTLLNTSPTYTKLLEDEFLVTNLGSIILTIDINVKPSSYATDATEIPTKNVLVKSPLKMKDLSNTV